MCKIRNKNSRSHRQSENPFLKEQIKEIIRAEQIRAVNERISSYHTSSKRWRDTVNMITGRQARNVPVRSTIDQKIINLDFQSINTDDQYNTPAVLSILDGTRIPPTIEVHTVWKFLSTLKRTAPGPDELPFWIWRDYAYHLAPTITKVFNSSRNKQLVPCLWKLANITPFPKETPSETCNQLRLRDYLKARAASCIEVCYRPRPVCLQKRMQHNLGAPYLSSSLAKIVGQNNRLCKSFLF